MGGGAVDWKKPEYTRYTLDKAPKLLKVQQTLAAEGLRDPWLRNHTWKYMTPQKQTSMMKIWKHPGVLQGFAMGSVFIVAYIVADQAYGLATGRKSDDGHH